jgi:hypothetical protein
MGQPAFQWPTPDGPPDNSTYWTSNLMPRWRYAVAFSQNQIDGTELQENVFVGSRSAPDDFDTISELLLGTPLQPEIRDELIESFADGGATDRRTMMELTIAGLLASPAYQWM